MHIRYSGVHHIQQCMSDRAVHSRYSGDTVVHTRCSIAHVENPRVEEAETRGSLELARSRSRQEACFLFMERTCLITLGGG